jgi:uncharacterized protein (DUF58 family)
MTEIFFYLLVLFAIAALMRVDFFFAILYLFFGAVVLSRVWSRRTLSNVRITRRYLPRAFLGEGVTVTLDIENTSWLPVLWLHVHESLPIELASPNIFRRVISLGPGAEVVLAYRLRGRRRGFYSLGPLTLATGDLFGLDENTGRLAREDHITVYPEIVSLERLGLPSVSPFVNLPSRPRLFEDTSRVLGVRDYDAGDPLHHINWKSTAAAGKLLVKKYEPAIAFDVMILLDLYGPHYLRRSREPASELAIVVAASVANHLAGQRQPVGLVTNGRDPRSKSSGMAQPVPTHDGRAHLMRILDVLARVELAELTPISTVLIREQPHLHWGTTMVIVAGGVSPGLLEAVLRARRAGIPVTLVLTDRHAPVGEIEQQQATLGVSVYRVAYTDQLRSALAPPAAAGPLV